MGSLATPPFLFNSYRLYRQPAGLTARSLKDLSDQLLKISETTLWYHLHHAYVQYRFDGPKFRNDIAVWVRDVIKAESLSEQLSYVDSHLLFDLNSARERMYATLQDWHRKNGDAAFVQECDVTKAFVFLQPQTVVVASGVSSNTLEGFARALRKISPQSVFYHTMEVRLRQKKNTSDFAAWIDNELGLTELAKDINLINPFFFTVDQYREQILQRIHQYV